MRTYTLVFIPFLLILFTPAVCLAQQKSSIKEIKKDCELDTIEGNAVIYLSYDLEKIPSSLNKGFIKIAKFKTDKNRYNPPSKLYTSFVLTPKNDVINFCSTSSYNNYQEIEAYIKKWIDDNQIKNDNYVRVLIYYSCLKWK